MNRYFFILFFLNGCGAIDKGVNKYNDYKREEARKDKEQECLDAGFKREECKGKSTKELEELLTQHISSVPDTTTDDNGDIPGRNDSSSIDIDGSTNQNHKSSTTSITGNDGSTSKNSIKITKNYRSIRANIKAIASVDYIKDKMYIVGQSIYSDMLNDYYRPLIILDNSEVTYAEVHLSGVNPERTHSIYPLQDLLVEISSNDASGNSDQSFVRMYDNSGEFISIVNNLWKGKFIELNGVLKYVSMNTGREGKICSVAIDEDELLYNCRYAKTNNPESVYLDNIAYGNNTVYALDDKHGESSIGGRHLYVFDEDLKFQYSATIPKTTYNSEQLVKGRIVSDNNDLFFVYIEKDSIIFDKWNF